MTAIQNAAAYLRLSREDDAQIESSSIQNQREIIAAFAQSLPELCLNTEYVDDGQSGVTFDRPSFQQMMEDVRSGRIQCILVKDLSRFGRNYIEAGRYLERIFPSLGVRFIAIEDGYDSTSTDSLWGSLLLPFKNLINDAYSRDISVKIRSHLAIKRKHGEFLGSFPPYGYRRSQSEHNRLEPDPYAASIVQDIFAWKLEGLSQQKIADRLNTEGVPSPLGYKQNKGLAFYTTFQKNPEPKWAAASVGRILKNPVYIGTLVQGRESTPNHKIQKRILLSPESWVCIENAHPPILPNHIFYRVNNMLKQDTRISPGKDRVYLLSGLLFCADCKSIMVRRTVFSKGRQYTYYHCGGHKQNHNCAPHSIREEHLTRAIFFALQSHLLCKNEKVSTYIEDIEGDTETVWHAKGTYGFKGCLATGPAQKQISDAKRKEKKYKALLSGISEDARSGLLDSTEKELLTTVYKNKLASTQAVISRLDAPPEAPQGTPFSEPKTPLAYSRTILLSYIQQILVYHGQRIAIIFRPHA